MSSSNRVSVDQACFELRSGELKVWLRLHDMSRVQRKTNWARLGRRWGADRQRIASDVRALVDKEYVSIEGSGKKTYIALQKRLDASGGAYLKYPAGDH